MDFNAFYTEQFKRQQEQALPLSGVRLIDRRSFFFFFAGRLRSRGYQGGKSQCSGWHQGLGGWGRYACAALLGGIRQEQVPDDLEFKVQSGQGPFF